MLKFGCTCYGNRNGGRGLYFNFQRFPLLLQFSTQEGKNNNTYSSSSLLVNYLVEYLGFSTHQSLSTSAKLLKSRNPKGGESKVSHSKLIANADCALRFYKQLGFQQSDISELIIRQPRLLVANVDTILKPKTKLLLELGFSGPELILVILKNPSFLIQNLGPGISAFRVVLGSDDNVVVLLKRPHRISFSGAAKYLIPNVELLQSCHYGIPSDQIKKHMIRHPKHYLLRTDVFRDNLIKVEQKLRIPKGSAMFLYGLHMVASLSEKSVEDRCQIFKSFGWTQSDVTTLITQNPLCLTSAVARIEERLDFLMNQVGYNPNFLASKPSLFTYSIKKRLLPRHRVLQALKKKGLLRTDYCLASAASKSDPQFLKKFVQPFEEVHQLYSQLTGSTVGSLPVGRQED